MDLSRYSLILTFRRKNYPNTFSKKINFTKVQFIYNKTPVSVTYECWQMYWIPPCTNRHQDLGHFRNPQAPHALEVNHSHAKATTDSSSVTTDSIRFPFESFIWMESYTIYSCMEASSQHNVFWESFMLFVAFLIYFSYSWIVFHCINKNIPQIVHPLNFW